MEDNSVVRQGCQILICWLFLDLLKEFLLFHVDLQMTLMQLHLKG